MPEKTASFDDVKNQVRAKIIGENLQKEQAEFFQRLFKNAIISPS